MDYLEKIKKLHPELRYGQIISNAMCVCNLMCDVFDIKDEALEGALKKYYELIIGLKK